MEPGYEHQTQQQSVHQPEPGTPVRAKDAMPRARTGLVLLMAFLAELIVIAAADNQWVADRITRISVDPNSRLQAGLRQVGLVFAWRFTPRSGDVSHFWVGSLALIGTTIVLSLLLIAAVVRGPVAFTRAFFGTWSAVTVSVFIGGYVRALVIDMKVPGQGSRFEQALFGSQTPSSATFLAGLGLGFVVAVIVGIVAPLTRRGPAVPLETAVPAGTAQVDNFFAPQDPPPWREERFGPPAPSNVTVDDDRTAALPRHEAPRHEVPQHDAPQHDAPQHEAARQDDAPTTALPVGVPERSNHEQTTDQTTEHPTEALRLTPPGSVGSSSGGYGSAPQSPYAPNTNAARSPAAEQSAEISSHHDTEHRSDGEHAEPTMAMPVVGGEHSASEHPRADSSQAQQTTEFPRPPDDEDIDPEHR